VSALFALAAKDSNPMYAIVAYIPLPAFWLLDGFYISKERQYRDLYKKISAMSPDKIDFSMNTEEFNIGKNTWSAGIFSKTLNFFYGITAAAILIVMFIIN
jgi:hypothetical protein